MSLSMAFPLWPCVPGLPIAWGGSPFFVLTAAVYAAALCLATPLQTMVRNIRGGETGRGVATVRRIPVEEADPPSHWPVE